MASMRTVTCRAATPLSAGRPVARYGSAVRRVAAFYSSEPSVRWDRECVPDSWTSAEGRIHRAWFSAYLSSAECPSGYWIDDVEGELPLEISGTFFRNGPGRLTDMQDEGAHPYDADGLVASISIRDGRAFFRSRFVETHEHRLETTAGRRLFRGAFGTRPTTSRSPTLRCKNSANTNVTLWKERLWSLYDCSQPYELDPYTLETLGPAGEAFLREGELFDIGLAPAASGVVAAEKAAQWLQNGAWNPDNSRGPALTAHPKQDPVTGTTLLYTYAFHLRPSADLLETRLTFYEMRPDFTIRNCVQYAAPGFLFVHDFAFTKQYYIAIENPVKLDLWSYVTGRRSAVGSISWKPNTPSRVHLIKRPDIATDAPRVAESTVIEVSPSFVFHFANAFEQDDAVVLDAVHYKQFPHLLSSGESFRDLSPETQPISRMRRTICRPNKRQDVYNSDVFLCAAEFPAVNSQYLGQPYRFAYVLAGRHPYRNAPPQNLTKVDMSTGKMTSWSPGEHYFAGEPVFLPRRSRGVSAVAEDDGWLLSLCYDGRRRRSELIILDALRLEAGPVAALKLHHGLPHGSHLAPPSVRGPVA